VDWIHNGKRLYNETSGPGQQSSQPLAEREILRVDAGTSSVSSYEWTAASTNVFEGYVAWMVAFRRGFVSMLPSSSYWLRLESLSGPVINPDPCVLGGVAYRQPTSLLQKTDWRTAS
jgi:hypothetical protein